MRRKRHLREVLARQWMIFALVLFAGFSAMTVLLAYMLEDRFIDDHLRDVGSDVDLRLRSALPAGFALHERAGITGALRERTEDQPPGAIREFRLPDGRYVHALAMRDRQGVDFLLIHDATGQLAVNAALARGWPWLLLIAVVLVLCAWGLARRFVARVSEQARDLVARIGEAERPEGLHALADESAIAEFGELARLNAKAWDVRQAVLDRERETLAFLAHELRTPLQSARTSLALLEDRRNEGRRDQGRRDNAPAWQRLHRAVDRLTRASHAVLWLGSDHGDVAPESCRVTPLLEALVEEFAPLVATKGQFLLGPSGPDISWPMPGEVAETVLANLLLNAIQHGSEGEIRIELQESGLCIDNPLPARPASPGFGLGLQLAKRLLERFGWALVQRPLPDGRMRVAVGPATNVAPASLSTPARLQTTGFRNR
jgi:signal transduction histidine kinase